MTSKDPAAADLERSSAQWLAWLARETARRQDRPGSALDALWDLLEEWFASDEFAASALAAAVAAPPDGRGPAAHAVLIRHRQATRRLLEDVARSAGARDPAALAAQLLTLVEGAIVGALVDRQGGELRKARQHEDLRPDGGAVTPAARGVRRAFRRAPSWRRTGGGGSLRWRGRASTRSPTGRRGRRGGRGPAASCPCG